MITGLTVPTAGKVLWDDTDLAGTDAESVWRHVCLVPQKNGHRPLTEPRGAVLVVGRLSRAAKKYVDRTRLSSRHAASVQFGALGALPATVGPHSVSTGLLDRQVETSNTSLNGLQAAELSCPSRPRPRPRGSAQGPTDRRAKQSLGAAHRAAARSAGSGLIEHVQGQ
ncbi:hypothetical protein [Streptomyces sp. NPDC017260]|uniref:hypothetical protein n=1 Tax=unclassified Streptomyces TaxID=2593676 RepID=UPI0037ACD0DA